MRALPLLELRVDDAVRKAFATDTDAFQHTVTLQLMKHQVSIDHTCTQRQEADTLCSSSSNSHGRGSRGDRGDKSPPLEFGARGR